MRIDQDILQRYMKPKQSLHEEEIANVEQKAWENLCQWGYSTENINGFEHAIKFVAREIVRRRYGEPFHTKGLLLCGTCGSGKTRLARWIAKCTQADYYSAISLDDAYVSMTPAEFEERRSALFKSDTIIVIDDLGSESGAKRYQNESFVSKLIERFYDRWSLYGTPIVITTNLLNTPVQNNINIASKYGSRSSSRLREMTDSILFTGNDRRAITQ